MENPLNSYMESPPNSVNMMRTYRQTKRMKNKSDSEKAQRDAKGEDLMGGDSLTHTNLYRQERQETSIQHRFHRFGDRLRRWRYQRELYYCIGALY